MPARPLVLAAVLALLLRSAATAAGDHATGMTSVGAGDARKPLPLLPMMAEHQKQSMREHLAAVQAIVAALARDGLGGAGKAAAGLGSSEAMGRMCEHLGAAAPGFTPMALAFHRTADTIGDAAARGDRAGVLTALDRTLQACVACDATYRQEIVDDATWKRLTAGPAVSRRRAGARFQLRCRRDAAGIASPTSGAATTSRHTSSKTSHWDGRSRTSVS
jgi:hypothetical protein